MQKRQPMNLKSFFGIHFSIILRAICFRFEIYTPNNEKICTKKDEFERLYRCKDGCKKACKILKYCYSVKDTENNARKSADTKHVTINLYVDTDVTIMTHSPLYGKWDIFSYVGGLMGCWMGISVWTLVLLLEKAFRSSAAAFRRMKGRKSTCLGKKCLF
ncbi:unnamed protein product [Larinioides sclopetarius]|uniref:Uncharacterized protein n=1 Tax=Larinioides sclopetarius TaxID=280406 RepID=A0AAV2BGN2_9ARAC